MEKQKVRAIVLVLASNELLYQQARYVWKNYMYLDPQIKVFFVYGKLLNLLLNQDENDLIFNDLEENYPNMIYKRIRGMEWIHSRYNYDYFIHTNITTFWDWSKLHKHLDILPKSLCYSGDGPLDGYGYNDKGYYLSGVDTIVTPEMISSIIEHQYELKTHLYEDQTLGSYFNGVLKAPMLPNRICFFEDILYEKDHNIVIDRINNAKNENKDHYRLKTKTNNRIEIHGMIYKHLLKLIYDIDNTVLNLSKNNKVNGTILSHFYNEEYLLPFWLKHHYSMFNHGIMIDYHSTDRSVQIIKELCPTWEIRTTRNAFFDAEKVDQEMMDIEEEVSGFKIILNTTEFLINTKLFDYTSTIEKCFCVNSYIVLPNSESFPSDENEFINNINTLCYQTERGYRSLHSYKNGKYTIGRHNSFHNNMENITQLFIVWCGFYPWNQYTINRKLQIKDKIPESDKQMGRGFQHLWSTERMQQEIKSFDNRKKILLYDLLINDNTILYIPPVTKSISITDLLNSYQQQFDI